MKQFPEPQDRADGRYTYLAAYAYALAQNGGDAAKAGFRRQDLCQCAGLRHRWPCCPQTFAEREIGDVLVTFEAETKSIAKQYADQGFGR